jgi:hypothetical protein
MLYRITNKLKLLFIYAYVLGDALFLCYYVPLSGEKCN